MASATIESGTAAASPAAALAPARGAWKSGPPRPSLTAGDLHVWRADLAAAAERLTETLSPAEEERAARILPASRAALWRRSRGLLRLLLGLYTGGEPRDLVFAVGPEGKPELAWSPALHFNLSHSGTTALYALSAAGPVGVDVEARAARPSTRGFDELALAARAFGAAEAARLAALDQPERRRAFLRCWTRHEAALKCAGAAGARGQRWVADLELDPSDPDDPTPGREPLDPPLGAVSLARAPRALRCYRL